MACPHAQDTGLTLFKTRHQNHRFTFYIKYKGPFTASARVPVKPKCYGKLEDSLDKLIMDVSK